MLKNCNGYDGVYSVTDDGRVYSHARTDARGNVRNGKWLKPIPSNAGYLRIHTCINGKRKKVMIHRLVAAAFVPKPSGKTEVNHKDGNKFNNAADNLEWVTPSENFIHALQLGLVVNLRNPTNGQFKRH